MFSFLRKKPKIVMGFWEEVAKRKPFFVLAPMADVTDSVFRPLIGKYSRHGQEGGGPDVFWTEFVSADGLQSVGRDKLIIDLKYKEEERPIVAQIFGSNEKNMEKTAQLCAELGFDGIDINMGCPDRAIEKQGCGCGHIKDKHHAVRIIKAVKKGAPNLPVSVKTRLGYNQDEVEEWVPMILKAGVAVLTMHCRTRKEMSKVPARWERMERIVEMRDQMNLPTLIVGNGDVQSLEDGIERATKHGTDGVMVGRGIFGNPWFFDAHKTQVTVAEKLEAMLEHTKTYVDELGPHKSFHIMKKHYKAYVNNFTGSKELRMALMEAPDYETIELLTREFMRRFPDVCQETIAV